VEGDAVKDAFKVAVIGGTASVIIIAGGFYIGSLRADLTNVRQETLAAQQQVQKLSTSLSQTEASLASASHAQEELKAQFAESTTKLESVSADVSKQIDALKQEVSTLKTNIAYRNKISGWWRDLFDYTKPFAGFESKRTAGQVP
jgi:chromosome segregation ATPase